MPRQVSLNGRPAELLASLPTLVAVADAGNLGRAARTLGVTKSAVSQAIAHAEGVLQVRLFDRNSRGVRLTDAGEAFLREIRSPLALLQEARERVSGLGSAVHGRLRITAPFVAFEWLIIPALARLAERHPALRVEVQLEDRLVDIVKEGFDAGVRLGDAVQQDMVGVEISEPAACVLVASPAYVARHGVPACAQELQRHRCIGFALDGAVHPWELGEQASSAPRLELGAALTVNGIGQTLSMARAGLGIACAVPRQLVADELDRGTLVELDRIPIRGLPPLMLYYPGTRLVAPSITALRHAFLPHETATIARQAAAG